MPRPRRFLPLAAPLISILVLTVACLGSNPNAGKTTPPGLPNGGPPRVITPPPLPAAVTRYPITVQRADGKTLTVRAKPARIVSLAPAITELIFAVGAQDALVAVDPASDYPPATAALAHVEVTASAAAIVAFKPDLVLASSDDAPAVAALDAAGIPVLSLKPAASLAEVLQQLLFCGDLTGHPDDGQRAAVRLRARIDAVQRRLTDVPQGPRVYLELDPLPLGATPNSLAGDILSTLKARNVLPPTDQPAAAVSTQSLASADPGVIVFADAYAGVTADSFKNRPGWSAIAAVQNGLISPVDPVLVTRPGPRAVDGLEALAKLLYPGKF